MSLTMDNSGPQGIRSNHG